MRVLTFSRFYPAYHPKKGKPTFFVEKIVNGLNQITNAGVEVHEKVDFNLELYYLCDPKFHTIRAGSRWKVGDWFSPRVWSDKPYRSKQIEFAPPIQVKKVWEVDIEMISCSMIISLPGERIGYRNLIPLGDVANNDGLDYRDFMSWFNKTPFTGQIICWNENINY